ncbi:ABC-type Fe3+ transport system substrate-binding protein [Maritimibacter alkaliphilus HTCC2654]|nr:extracellular solute-binding protein [Maritimibacter alkaliphilus]TYP80459.1 ABC-type Fe3+ transport system substrate-binding protein [Maritimibacter alkaliphilus HTCC2654]
MFNKLVASVLAGSMLFAASSATAQSDWKSSPEVEELYAKAKEEGSVVMWGTNGREVEWIPAAFAAEFPGIDVQVVGDNDIVTKAIAEARAGRHEVDVFWHSITGVQPLNQRSLFSAVDWSLFGVDPANTAFDKGMGFTNNIVYVFAYNTELADTENLPTNWKDLLDPKYKGQMAGSLFLAPRLVSALSIEWGQEEALDFARGLMEQDMLLTRAPRDTFLQSGERIYAAIEVDTLPKLWAESGLPVDFVVPEPAVLGQFGSVLMNDAPHPNAGLLLAGWLASEEGKAARKAAIFEDDLRPNADNELAQMIWADGKAVVDDTPEVIEARSALYKEAGDILSGQAD